QYNRDPAESVDVALGDRIVRVDAAIAEERPVRPGRVDLAEIDGDEENLLLVDRCLCQDLPAGAGDEALAPELDPLASDRRLEPDTIDRGNVAAVGHRMAALD